MLSVKSDNVLRNRDPQGSNKPSPNRSLKQRPPRDLSDALSAMMVPSRTRLRGQSLP